MDSFQDIIQYLVSGVNPITNINEIATVMCASPSTVYGYRNQGTEPKFSQVVALNKFWVEQKGCHILERVFRPPGDDDSYSRIQSIKEELAALEAELDGRAQKKLIRGCGCEASTSFDHW